MFSELELRSRSHQLLTLLLFNPSLFPSERFSCDVDAGLNTEILFKNCLGFNQFDFYSRRFQCFSQSS